MRAKCFFIVLTSFPTRNAHAPPPQKSISRPVHTASYLFNVGSSFLPSRVFFFPLLLIGQTASHLIRRYTGYVFLINGNEALSTLSSYICVCFILCYIQRSIYITALCFYRINHFSDKLWNLMPPFVNLTVISAEFIPKDSPNVEKRCDHGWKNS